VVAESFGDIFYANCFQNGLLPIRLPGATVEALAAEALRDDRPFTIDLVDQVVRTPGGAVVAFEIDPMRRESLLEGLDDVRLTLRHASDIEAWQARDRRERPWVWSLIDTRSETSRLATAPPHVSKD
jgi:3-isopropylmalate/(R)-2-methylmalate dehydratase small subunit